MGMICLAVLSWSSRQHRFGGKWLWNRWGIGRHWSKRSLRRVGTCLGPLCPLRHHFLRENVAHDAELPERLAGFVGFAEWLFPLMTKCAQRSQGFLGAQTRLSAIHRRNAHSFKFLQRITN